MIYLIMSRGQVNKQGGIWDMRPLQFAPLNARVVKRRTRLARMYSTLMSGTEMTQHLLTCHCINNDIT